MSESNYRIKDYETVHHLRSRIAHQVFFLGDEEKNDLIEIIRRTSQFSGIRLLGWCLMTNHFHILAYLPTPVVLDEEEILRRYGILRGKAARAAAESQLAKWHLSQDGDAVDKWLNSQRHRMYDIGEFMKIIKQWFTEEYNRRHKHVGTLWDSVYRDRLIPCVVRDMSHVLAYIHLNPIRAAITNKFDDYVWSSFTAFAKGDGMAAEGLRFVYDDVKASSSELKERHSLLMDELLEGIKRERAEDIARKRAVGYRLPQDPLTNEATVAQAAAHLAEVQSALVSLLASRDLATGTRQKLAESAELLFSALETNPSADAKTLAEILCCNASYVYKLLSYLQRENRISRPSRTAPWQLKRVGEQYGIRIKQV